MFFRRSLGVAGAASPSRSQPVAAFATPESPTSQLASELQDSARRTHGPVASDQNATDKNPSGYLAYGRSGRRECPFCLGEIGITTPVAQYVQHANELLEALDEAYAEQGGLLALLPHEEEGKPTSAFDDAALPLPLSSSAAAEHSPRALASQTLLGQWMLYTQALVERVGHLEREVSTSRALLDTLAHGLDAPVEVEGVSAGKARLKVSERFVLAGTQDRERWAQIDSSLAEKSADTKERERRARQQGVRSATRAGVGGVGGVGGGAGGSSDDVVWIDVPSRIYRARGSGVLFLVPMHGATALEARALKVASTPLVQTVPRRCCRRCHPGIRGSSGAERGR
ncbi:MAG: hypothetical protein M1819_005444 [Sarea resinae]|nr:MAG: hypothetical protein M1819_005444 [Sarea resinae]